MVKLGGDLGFFRGSSFSSKCQHPPLQTASLATLSAAMIGENRQLVTNEPVEFGNNRLKFKTAGKIPIILEEFIEYTPI